MILLDRTIRNCTTAAAVRSCWLKRAAQTSAWDPSQAEQGCRWNWLLLSLGLIQACRVHRSFFISSVGFGSDPVPLPGLGLSVHFALHTVGIPVRVCSISVREQWKSHRNELSRICFLSPLFLPSFTPLLALHFVFVLFAVNSPLLVL